jgi:hypothetical protein
MKTNCKYRTRFESGHPGAVCDTLHEAIVAVTLLNEVMEFHETEDGERLRFGVGPLTFGYIEPSTGEGN